MLPSGSSEYETNVTSSPTSGAPGTAAKAGFGGWFGGGGGGGCGGGSDGPASTVISLVLASVSPALSSTRIVTLHVPGAGAMAVAVPSGDFTSNLLSPVNSQRVLEIGMEGSSGVEVEVKVTDVPVTTGFGAQSKSAVGFPMATPTPSGDTTAASVSKHAVSRSLTRLMHIQEPNVRQLVQLAVWRHLGEARGDPRPAATIPSRRRSSFSQRPRWPPPARPRYADVLAGLVPASRPLALGRRGERRVGVGCGAHRG